MSIIHTSIQLQKNPLIKRLQPVKNPSKIPPFFKNLWKKISYNFVPHYPSPIKENRARSIRPDENSKLTVSHLWNHYQHYLKEDRDCPFGLKTCFQRMEKDEKKIFKMARAKDPDKAQIKQDAYIAKTLKEIESLPLGKSRLFAVNQGTLFCTITRTSGGFTLNFMGTGPQMMELEGKEEPEFNAGKEKVLRCLTYEITPLELKGFASEMIENWVKSEIDSSDILEWTASFTKNESSDTVTCSNRADKLFWNIVQSLLVRNGENSRDNIRSLRLRTELLVLYETFNNERSHLNPQTKEYADLRKLQREVSSKVLLSYRKGYISEKDFTEIKNRLVIIDQALVKAQQKPSKIIASKTALPKHVFQDVSLKKSFIRAPKNVTETLIEPQKSIQTPSQLEIPLKMDHPFSLDTFTSMDARAKVEHIDKIYSKIDILKTGTPEERKWESNELLRFFYEAPYFEMDLKDLSSEEAKKAETQVIELLDIMCTMRSASTLTDYDYQSIIKMHNFIIYLHAQNTGIWVHNLLNAGNGTALTTLQEGITIVLKTQLCRIYT